VPFTYGQLPASRIQAASSALRAHIAANPPHVPPAIHRLHPRITALHIEPAEIDDGGKGWAASATVKDGIETYVVTVKLGQTGGQWLATRLLLG
jgi:hypothetical protein